MFVVIFIKKRINNNVANAKVIIDLHIVIMSDVKNVRKNMKSRKKLVLLNRC